VSRTTDSVLPPAGTEFGARVRHRLAEERVIWLSTVSDRGSPEPNPVWFLWEDEGFTLFNDRSSRRVANVLARPPVTLHFDGGPLGRNIVVFRGRAEVVAGTAKSAGSPGYLAKYAADIDRIMGGRERFLRSHPTVIRVRPHAVRGR
jgi:PPOX class probable F420-dependent enzyme